MTPFFERRASDYCHVKTPVNYLGKRVFLCLDKNQFKKALEFLERGKRCFYFDVEFQVGVSLKNPGDHEAKRVFTSLRAISMRPQRQGSIFWVRLWSQIEGSRERISEALSYVDRFGIFRKIFLNESIRGSPLPMLLQIGFVHLFNATAIHLYALLFWTSFFVRRSSFLSQKKIPIAMGLIGVVGGFLFILSFVLSGMRQGMFRPLMIVVLRGLGKTFGVRFLRFSPLILCLGVDLIVSGVFKFFFNSTWAPGTTLYALAVGGALMALENRKRGGVLSHFYTHLKMSLFSWCLPTAVELFFHNGISVATPILSMITLPFFANLLFPIGLLACLLECFHLQIVPALYPLIEASNCLVEWLSSAAMTFQSYWAVSGIGVFLGFCFSMATLFFGRRFFWIFALCALTLRLQISNDHSESRVIQLDVGQGDAALVIKRNEIGLIDAGPYRSMNVVKWFKILLALGIKRIDWVYLTHLDEDHVGGLVHLASIINIGCVEIGSGEHSAREFWLRGLFPRYCKLPDTAQVSGKSARSRMGGISIDLGKQDVYLNLGDAPNRDELRLLQQLNLKGKDIFLKISHHGSRYSSNESLFKLISVKEAWISAGYRNHYGHPSKKVLSILRKKELPTKITYIDGAIEKSIFLQK